MKTLLSIYEKHPILYNHLSRQYKDAVLQESEFDQFRTEVQEACTFYQRVILVYIRSSSIANKICVCGCTPSLIIPDLKAQIKNIRDTYCRERIKVLTMTKKKTGTDMEEVIEYTPKLVWYNDADAFLQPFVDVRERKENPPNMNTATRVKATTSNVNTTTNEVNMPSDAEVDTETQSESLNSGSATGSRQTSKRRRMRVVSDDSSMKSSSTLETMLDRVSEMREEARSVLHKSDKDVCGYFGELVAAELRTFPALRQLRARQQIQEILLQHAEEMTVEAMPLHTTPSSVESTLVYTIATGTNGEITLQALPTDANNESVENKTSVP